jgi:hypothetical protein
MPSSAMLDSDFFGREQEGGKEWSSFDLPLAEGNAIRFA